LLADHLLANSVRMTAQRRVLIEVIQEAGEHLDARMLLQLARRRMPGIDRATVYRTIELLKKFGLVSELGRFQAERAKRYYEARTNRDRIRMACLLCGRVDCFFSSLFDRLKTELSHQTGFEIHVIRLELGGSCKSCCAPKRPDVDVGSTEDGA
jgi:Fur family ferric uptake transcriptional regulator